MFSIGSAARSCRKFLPEGIETGNFAGNLIEDWRLLSEKDRFLAHCRSTKSSVLEGCWGRTGKLRFVANHNVPITNNYIYMGS
jgi:hypothetical protein